MSRPQYRECSDGDGMIDTEPSIHALPAPLISPEVDLRPFKSMPLDVRRMLNSRASLVLSGDEFQAAFLLWCAAWHQVPAGSVPDDDEQLAELSMAADQWSSLRPGALRGFARCSDGRLYHPFICDQAKVAWVALLKLRARYNRRVEMQSGMWADLRMRVFRRDNFTCTYCGSREGGLEADHVIPLSRGGPSTEENVVTACKRCNRSKGAKTLEEWRN